MKSSDAQECEQYLTEKWGIFQKKKYNHHFLIGALTARQVLVQPYSTICIPLRFYECFVDKELSEAKLLKIYMRNELDAIGSSKGLELFQTMAVKLCSLQSTFFMKKNAKRKAVVFFASNK